MSDTEIKPNIVIVKLNNELVSFPLSDDGVISDGQGFESDYILEDYHLIFANYNDQTNTSVELSRFAHLRDDKETSVKVLYDEGGLADFIYYIIENNL